MRHERKMPGDKEHAKLSGRGNSHEARDSM